VLQTYERASSQ
jgi:hypothetical protein